MTPRSGPGGAGSDPRAPKTTPRRPQERPKSRPEAVSEQPWRPSGADLAPKRLPEPSGEACGPLGLGFWRLRGSLFEASSASCAALRGAGASANAQAQAQAQSASAGGQEPRTAGSKAAEPQGLGGPAGYAEHLNKINTANNKKGRRPKPPLIELPQKHESLSS